MRIAEIFDLGHSSGYDRYDRYGRGKKDGGRRRFGRRRRRGGLIRISILG